MTRNAKPVARTNTGASSLPAIIGCREARDFIAREALVNWPPLHPLIEHKDRSKQDSWDRSRILLLCPRHLMDEHAFVSDTPIILVCHFSELLACPPEALKAAASVILAGSAAPAEVLSLARHGYGCFHDHGWQALHRHWRVHLRLHRLSSLELRLLRDLRHAHNNAALATRLHMEAEATRQKMRSLLHKLELSNRSEAVAFSAFHDVELDRMLDSRDAALHHR